jgi:hypothetical protein
VKKFDDGKYPNLKKKDSSWSSLWLSFNWTKFKDSRWFSQTGDKDFILLDGRMIFWEKHSFLSKWKNVVYAWEIHFSWKWNITSINNKSWHYQSDFKDISEVTDFLKNLWLDTWNINLAQEF